MALFALMAWRDSQGMMLYPPTPEPACNCETDSYDCGDFTTHDEAQDCFENCWVLTGRDVHHLGGDGDFRACERRSDNERLAERQGSGM